MTAVWLRARAELRSRIAALLSLGLIVGVVGGVVLAAAAGARRTESAYPRFLQAEHAMDYVIDATGRDRPAVDRLVREVEHLPQVEASAHVTLAKGFLRVPGRRKPGNVFAIVSLDGRFGTVVNRVKILEGRMYDPSAPDEIVPSFAVANDLGMHVGETVKLVYGGLFANVLSPGGPPPVSLHVVGIGALPNAFQPLAGGYIPAVLFSPGFRPAHTAFINPHDVSIAVRFRHGSADLAAFEHELTAIRQTLQPHLHLRSPFVAEQQTLGVQQTTHAQAVALWALAALVALAGLAIFGQALARQTFLESIDHPTLRALGIAPSQLVVIGVIRAAMIGVVGAAVASIVGFLLSPMTPTGVARIAEPNPGFALDGGITAIGAAAIVVVVVLLGGVPAWRAAWAKGTALGTAELRGARRPSLIAGFMSRRAFPPSATAGVRMALEPGRGRTAVPVRTTIFGAALSLVALSAALGFGVSLDRLVTTPALSGWNWDTMAFASNKGEQRLIQIFDRSKEVAGYSLGTVITVKVGTIRTNVEALDPHRGTVTPSLIEGRLPVGVDQIALGTETMRDLHTHVGATVVVRGDIRDFRMRVVGRIAMPDLFFSFTRPGQGAATSLRAAELISPSQSHGGGAIFARFTPGTDSQAFMARVHRRVPDLFVVPQQQSGQLASLNQVGGAPIVLAGIVALMAAATLAHTLITSIRRRRLDLAILKTIGFVRRQVSATVAWQATTLAAIALVVGLPLGVIAGRWGWNVFADHLGVVPDSVVPVVAILLAVPATILVANLLALVPGRIASRLKAASVMRTE